MGRRAEGQRPRHPLPTLHPGQGRQETSRRDDRKGTRREASKTSDTAARLEQLSDEGWHAYIDGNLTATVLTIKRILQEMKERRSGSIITLSSAAARRPTSRPPMPYAVAKGGIEPLTKALA